MRFFIYSRKSVETGRGESIENQVQLCREHILAAFPQTGPEDIWVYEDEGFSGKTLERPQFRRMMTDLRREAPDFVVCYRLDRISRSVVDFAGLIETLNAKGVAFLCIREQFDTSTPMGKAMMYIASVFAQLERETIAQRVRDNMLLLARTGRWLGGQAPTGFTARQVEEVILDGRVKRSCQLEPLHRELARVRAVYDEFWTVRTLHGVCRRLAERSLRPRSGEPFSPVSVKELLQNPVYCAADQPAWDYFTALGSQVCFSPTRESGCYGLLRYNRRDYTRAGGLRNPPDRWIIAQGRHPAVISGQRWVEIQALLAANRPAEPKPAPPHNDYALLSGLIRCQRCAGRLFAKRRSRGTGFDYICQTKLRRGTAGCGCPNLNGPEADGRAWAVLALCAPPAGRLLKALEELREALARELPDPRQLREEKRQEIRRLMALLSTGEAGPALIRRVDARLGQLEEELAGLERVPAEPPLPQREGLSLPEPDLSQRQALARLLIREGSWNGECLRLTLWQPDGAIFPREGIF